MTLQHISGILLILLSLVLLCFPRQIWMLTEAWKNSKTATPSTAYGIVLRCAGAVFLVSGFIVFFII